MEGRIGKRKALDDSWLRLLTTLRSVVTPPLTSRGLAAKKTREPKRVLVVEDDIDSARSLALLVATMGHEVDYAINGYVALSSAKRYKPDIILLDLGLPGLNGLEVCDAIKRDAEMQRARVIVISAYNDPNLKKSSEMAGCERYLVKPVETAVLEHLLS